jgi:hypothetical protein
MNKYTKLAAVILPTLVALAVALDQTGVVKSLHDAVCVPAKPLTPMVLESPDAG